MDEDIYPDELYHYGRKGMKWGQHIFGKERSSGTSKKKKSDAGDRFKEAASNTGKKVASSVKNAVAARKEKKYNEKLHTKKVSEMSDSELRDYIDRMNLERQAAQTRQQVKQMDPQKVGAGQRFISSLGRDVIAPAAKNVGRQYLEKVLRDAAGLNGTGKKDPLADLRAEVDELGLKAKKATFEKTIRDREKEAAEANKTKSDTSSNSSSGSDSSQSSQRTTSSSNSSNSSSSSQRTQQQSRPSSIPVEDYTVESVSPDTYSNGYNYVQNSGFLNSSVRGLLPAASLPSGDDDDRRRR